MSEFSAFWTEWATSPTAELDGMPCRLKGGATFWLRRAGGRNAAWKAAQYRIAREMQAHRDSGRLYELVGAATRRAFFECCVVRWEGTGRERGEEMPFTAEAFEALCAAMPDLFEVLADFAEQRAAYRETQIREAGEQVGNVSSGSANGDRS